ncbi:MAG: DinB family protein [Vicinamibacterales bacterium]
MHDIARLMLRELDGLRRELEAYPDDDTPWRRLEAFPNSGANLALHVVGNLRHFVGGVLGGSGFVRDRQTEFARTSGARTELVALVDAARHDVVRTFADLAPAALDQPYPEPPAPLVVSTRLFLMHLCAHLAFHLGQIDYHRRAVTGDRRSAGPLPLDALGGTDAPAVP